MKTQGSMLRRSPAHWSPVRGSPVPLAAGALAISLLSGCSALGMGSTQYSCPGMPDGVRCLSARQVYEKTHHGQVPRPTAAKARKSSAARPVPVPTTAAYRPRAVYPASGYGRSSSLRTPARVMRIWVAPWVDDQGDLMMPSVIYTEIEPRRWTIGESAPKSPSVLRPLSSVQTVPTPKVP